MSVTRRDLFRTLLPLRREGGEAAEPSAAVAPAVRSTGAPPPVVRLRAGLAPVATATVGSGVGAARGASPAPERPLPAGLALQVVPARCLAKSSFCSVCTERCPVPGALALVDGVPVVTPACTGCGLCIRMCPAPVNAFQLVPRPTPQSAP